MEHTGVNFLLILVVVRQCSMDFRQWNIEPLGDAVSVLLQAGYINRSGRLIKGKSERVISVDGVKRYILASADEGANKNPIFITESDIENVIDIPLTNVKGIGKGTAETLKANGILTLEDLVCAKPEDLSKNINGVATEIFIPTLVQPIISELQTLFPSPI